MNPTVCEQRLVVQEHGTRNHPDRKTAAAKCLVPINVLLDFNRTRHVNRFAHLVFDVVLTPFEEIVIAFAPADDTVVIADGFQRRVESVVTSGACGRQNGFTKGHAIKPIVANDELLRPLRTTDQRIAKIARASQRPRNEVDFFRDRALGLGLTDEVADPCFCGTSVT